MTSGLPAVAMQALLLVLLVLVVTAVTGCAAHAGSGPSRAAPARLSLLAPSPVRGGPAQRDPAVWAAVVFERAHCAWDWHETPQAYLGRQQKLATAGYAARLAAASDPVSWRNVVVAQKQTVTCTIVGPSRVVGAPSTADTVYVRMTVNTEITSTLGTFAVAQQIASWLVARTGRGWLVAGSFEGG